MSAIKLFASSCFVLILIGVGVVPGWASTGALYLMFDNDFIVNSDDDYTNGLGLGWASVRAASWEEVPSFGWLAPFVAGVPLVNEPARQHFVSFNFAQLMFTPAEIKDKEPDPLDRPYAGVAFLATEIHQFDLVHKDSWLILVGMIGPETKVGETQEMVHSKMGANQPQGWDNQIGNELLVNMAYNHRWRLIESPAWRTDWGSDLIMGGFATLGNLRTGVIADLTWRLGYRMNPGFGKTATRLASEGRIVPTSNDRPWGMSLNIGLAGEAVLWDATLDGRLFGDDTINVHKESLLGRYIVALTAQVSRFQCVLQFVRSTRTFHEEKANPDYGRFTVGWTF